jgi:hypothetical protein
VSIDLESHAGRLEMAGMILFSFRAAKSGVMVLRLTEGIIKSRWGKVEATCQNTNISMWGYFGRVSVK